LAAFVPEAAAAYKFDASRVYALGYSNGANIAAAVLLLHPGALAGGALLRAVLPLEPASPPSLEAKPVLIAAGADDPYSDRSRVEALSDRLAGGGANVELRWAQRGHELELTNWTRYVTGSGARECSDVNACSGGCMTKSLS